MKIAIAAIIISVLTIMLDGYVVWELRKWSRR